MIQGLSGVIIWTADLDAMLGFYRAALCLTPHSTRPHFVSFKWGEVRLAIGTHSEIRGKSSDPHRVMINLAVDDIDAEYERLRSAGVEFIRPPGQEHWDGWVCTFYDFWSSRRANPSPSSQHLVQPRPRRTSRRQGEG